MPKTLLHDQGGQIPVHEKPRNCPINTMQAVIETVIETQKAVIETKYGVHWCHGVIGVYHQCLAHHSK